MRSNYRRLGDFIREVKVRNTDMLATNLQGVNIDKFFMPSVANIVGTDLSVYRIVKKNQFACNRMHVGRDYRLPIALSKSRDDFIVSPAYDVFEIEDTTKLLPEYLMMWFTRSEFDRNAWFYTDADVRGGLPWKSFCDMQLPIPSPEKQEEIVKEYHTIVNRIKLNEQLCQKLKETAQAIYKQWFVDFEFPDENGNPYKSSGGEMVYNEELKQEVPKGWEVGRINNLAQIIDGDRGNNYPSQEDFSSSGYCLFLNAGNVTKIGFEFSNLSFITRERDSLLRKGKLLRNDIVITTRGTVGNIALFSKGIEYDNIRINSGMIILRSLINESSAFLYSLMRSEYMKMQIGNFLTGSAQPQLPIKDILLIPITIPKSEVIISYFNIGINIQNQLDVLNKQNKYLKRFRDVLLAKQSKL